MKTKQKILEILQAHSQEWVSGESIAVSLEISRAAVWKAAAALRDEGYVIDAVRNKGYRLVEETDVLSELGILKYLDPQFRMLDIHIIQSAQSTNALLWEREKSGADEGTVLIACMQTEGRGRFGRRFYSPADTGIYMSILLRPRNENPDQAMRYTTMAAVAACETFEAASGKPASIKWVNDIFMSNRKVCGILTEGSFGIETGKLDAVVIGVGINAYQPENGFPAEIESTAGAVYGQNQTDGKNILAAGFLNRLMRYYLWDVQDSYVQKYRQRCFVIGKEITVNRNGKNLKAIAKDVDENCRLIVQYEDGAEEKLIAGEIGMNL